MPTNIVKPRSSIYRTAKRLNNFSNYARKHLTDGSTQHQQMFRWDFGKYSSLNSPCSIKSIPLKADALNSTGGSKERPSGLVLLFNFSSLSKHLAQFNNLCSEWCKVISKTLMGTRVAALDLYLGNLFQKEKV